MEKETKKENTGPRCKRCGRPLKSVSSIENGYGYSCFLKNKKEKIKGYFKNE
jgi:ribosomal protein L34E